MGFSGGSDGKKSACNAGDLGLILGLEDSLEKGMTTHSSILAWRIPWTEEPKYLSSFPKAWFSESPICPWDFPGKNTGVGCHFLLQGIFLTQGSNPSLLHWQVDSLLLSHQGSPLKLITTYNYGDNIFRRRFKL